MPAASGVPPVTGHHAAEAACESVVRRRDLSAAAAVLFFILMVATGALDVATSVREERSFDTGASPRVIIRDGVGGGLRGGIELRAGGGDTVRVESRVHATWRVRYVLEKRGNDVVIEAQPRPGLGWLGLLGPVRFTVTAPAETSLDVETRRAAIEVRGIAGGGSLRTTNGTIRLEGVGGHLSATTTNGAIMADRFAGTAELRTTNGSIDVHGSRGAFDVTTINGPIVLDAELRPGERHRVVTTNGRVTVRLQGDPSLRVDAHATTGAVMARRPIAAREKARNALAGIIGGGEGELLVRTTNGDITIE